MDHPKCTVFWAPMPAQVAAVETSTSHRRTPLHPFFPPPHRLTMRKLFRWDERSASEAADGEIRITMVWVNDVGAMRDTKSLLKKPLGLEVKGNERVSLD